MTTFNRAKVNLGIKFAAIAATVLSILFPPFTVSANVFGSKQEATSYAFIFTGPEGVREAKKQLDGMNSFFGSKGPKMMEVKSSIAFFTLLMQIAAIWGVYFALTRFGVPYIEKQIAALPKE